MVSILQVYVPFKLNFIQHILFMPITTKAIKFFFYLCFCFYRIPLVHPLVNRGNAAAFSSTNRISDNQCLIWSQNDLHTENGHKVGDIILLVILYRFIILSVATHGHYAVTIETVTNIKWEYAFQQCQDDAEEREMREICGI